MLDLIKADTFFFVADLSKYSKLSMVFFARGKQIQFNSISRVGEKKNSTI